MQPNDPHWHSWVEAPLVVDDAEQATWNETAQVVVVGFGAAGGSAALEAADAGADVLVVERFDGGGATALSGGIVYAGATPYQRDAGFNDTPEEMFKYLRLETLGIVRDETLQRFCRQSAANLEWLKDHGTQFAGILEPRTCSYPGEGNFLYYSGNEATAGYREQAVPAPRGHRVVGKRSTGRFLYRALRESAQRRRNIRVMTHSPVARLVIDRGGRVIGVEAIRIPAGTRAWRRHRRLVGWVNKGIWAISALTEKISRKIEAIEKEAGERVLIRATQGVILASGGFAQNSAMIAHHAPLYRGVTPLGSVGCDGAGIRLGQSVGGHVARLDRVGVGVSVKSSEAFLQGILVNGDGQRFINEDCYGATLGLAVAEKQNGKAWLILDRALTRQAWREGLSVFRKSFIECSPILFGLMGAKKGRTLEELAWRCGMPGTALRANVTAWNAALQAGADPLGKSEKYLRALGDSEQHGPFIALDASVASKSFPSLALTQGGLAVDEDTGQVLREEGQPVTGLYAAGRTAVGLLNAQISGLNLADAVFSGRRAGRAVARSQ